MRTRLPAQRPISGDCEQSAGIFPPRAQTRCDDRVWGAGPAEALFAFLEPAVHAGGVEPFFGFDADRVVVLSHRVLLSGAELLLTLRTSPTAAEEAGGD